ncbi:MAG: hypothetical protein HY901_14865 [Deltaproteobacteria bacterium]|nr:hypothetical protein [Deltaproteobacteria bacterium]
MRNQHGELEVGTYAELRTLYLRQFISDDDEIRREGSDRWVKAGAMPDLRSAKPRPYFHGNEFGWLVVAITVFTLLLFFVMNH